MATTISCTPQAVVLDDGEKRMEVAWSEVEEIYAYRLDVVVRQISYLCFCHASGHELETSSEMQGWASLLAAVADFAGLDPAKLRAELESLQDDDESLVLFSK